MKKLLFLLPVCMLLVLFLLPTQVNAATVDDLTYTISGGQVTITKCKTSASGDLVIPATIEGFPVTAIHDFAFNNCSKLTSIIIPEGVTTIGTKAFAYCKALTDISFPNSLLCVGDYLFYQGSSNLNYNEYEGGKYYGNEENPYLLFSYYLQHGATSVAIHPDTKLIGARAFADKSLTQVVIPDGVIFIGTYAFYRCTNMSSLVLPKNLQQVDSNAFSGCKQLEEISFPDGAVAVERNAFSDCPNIKFNTYDNALYLGNPDNPYAVLFKAVSTDIATCTIHKDTTTLFPSAFVDCVNISTITLPEKLLGIGADAFSGCSNLEGIYIPDGVVNIGEYAFGWCRNMTQIHLPANLSTVSEGMLFSCNKLTSVQLPSKIKSIGYKAFLACSNLENMEIPEGVTGIDGYAFSGCEKMAYVTIPKTVNVIANWAFLDCYALKTVYYSGTQEQWDSIDFTTGNEKLLEAELVLSQANIAGDFTGDGEVNNEDVVRLLWNNLFPDQYPLENGDINSDGSITNEDVVLLMWHVLFPDIYPLP